MFHDQGVELLIFFRPVAGDGLGLFFRWNGKSQVDKGSILLQDLALDGVFPGGRPVVVSFYRHLVLQIIFFIF